MMYYKHLAASILIFIIILKTFAQTLPHKITEEETLLMPNYLLNVSSKGVATPPASKVRTMAEWEEIQTLIIAWKGYESILSQIVDAAQNECKVLINCTDSSYVKSKLINNGINISNNVKYLITPTNSVWCRDYSAASVYTNDVDSLLLVDWVYNRPRPDDDNNPSAVAAYHGYPLYQTINSPWKLVNTGGNFMTDGLGTAFAEKLILDDNPDITETEIDNIVDKFMGISRYIKFTNLPDDGIHHIDMHMKIIDEETLLVGKFPNNVNDGQQIEANLLYLLNNYNSVFGSPYKIVRIPMPPSQTGNYPPNSYYRTYTNGVFVNKTYIVPTYYEAYDTIALRILSENLTGYNIVGINCQQIISASGAIHCITNSVGNDEPLLITHQQLDDTYNNANDYEINAIIKTKSGVASATVFYRTDTLLPFQTSPMFLNDVTQNIWTAYIPYQQSGTTVYYYIEAEAQSGKKQVRPITAPAGYWEFQILMSTDVNSNSDKISLAAITEVFPNPAKAITCIIVKSSAFVDGTIKLCDINGRSIKTIYSGKINKGENMYFFDASEYNTGVYIISLEALATKSFKKILIR